MAISVGSKAPDFTLKSKQASGLVDVKLSNNFGKKNTVLLFFPLAFTSVCTTEMCDVTAGLERLCRPQRRRHRHQRGQPVRAGSVGARGKNRHHARQRFEQDDHQAYDVVFPMLAGVGDTAARAAFVIDKNGVVQYSEQTPTPKDLPNFEAVKAALAKLK